MKMTTRKNRARGSGLTSPGYSERLKLAPLALAAALALGGVGVRAAPTGGVVVAGDGSISQPNAQTTHVHQNSKRMVVEWNSFNLASNETVNFYQPSSSAWVLNQILGGDATVIRGRINANGNVILVNGNGVYFGKTARLSVGSLVASSLGLSTDKFMSGKLAFERQENSNGRVVNRGVIEANGDGNGGGSVSLLGASVENTGKIVAKAGRINLAVGERITLDFDGDGLMRFAVDEALKTKIEGLDAVIRNSGELSAEGGEVALEGHVAQDVLYHVVNNEGIIRAGRIDNTGGVIRLVGVGGEGTSVVNTGTLDAAGRDAQSTGGKVHVLGERVQLTGEAVVNASGAKGGGEILIGGDYQGKNPDVMNAQRTYVGYQVKLKADATDQGDGGKVIVWADDWTKFYGSISARGGEYGGDGGFAEVSGKNYLEYRGLADLRAPMGSIGTLLLDPTNITITNVTSDVVLDPSGDPDVFEPDGAASNSTLDVTELETQLGLSNVLITTNSGGADDGDITVATAVTWTSGNTLTLEADNNIVLNANVNGGSTGNLDLNAGGSISGTGAVTVDNLTINAGADVTLNNTANDFGTVTVTSGQNVTLVDTNAIVLGASTISGDLSVTAGGNITDSGDLSVTGTTTLAAGSGNDITLDDEHDFGGAVSVTSGGNVRLNDANAIILGASNISGNLIVTTGDNITVAGLITTQGGDVQLEADSPHADASAANGSGTLAFTGTGGVNTNGGDITLIAADFNLAGSNTINAGAGDINLALSRNSETLTLGTGGILTSVELDRFRTTGTLTLGQATTVDGATLNAPNIQVNSTLNLGNLAGTLFMSTTGGITIGGNVVTGGSQAYGAAVMLTGGTRTLTTNTPGSILTFEDTVTGDGSALNLDGNVVFKDAVTSVGVLDIDGDLTLENNLATLTLASLDVSGVSTLYGDVTTTGDQNYGGDVFLKDGNRTLEGDNLDFGGGVSADDGLILIAYTNMTFSGSVEGALIEIRINQSGNADVELDLSGLSKLYSSAPILLVGGGQDSLLGLLIVDNAWQVTGIDSGTLMFVDPDQGQVTVQFEGFTRLVGGNLVDTFDVSGTFNGGIEGGLGNDVLNLIGTGSVTRFIGGGGTDTYDIRGLATHPYTLVWNPNDIQGVEELLGNGDTLRLAGNSAVAWALTGGADVGTFTVNSETVNFQGFTRLETSSSGNNTWTSDGVYAGNLQLNGRNEWLFQAATRLTQGQIVGNGMLIIARRQGEGPTQNSNFTIGASDLVLADMAGFTGDLVVGGSITGSLPLKGTTNVEINADQLVVAESFTTGGDVVLMGSDIVLDAGFNAGSSSTASLIAAGDVCNGCDGLTGDGAIVVHGSITLSAGGGQMIAAQGITNSKNLTLDFNGGPLELAVSSQYADKSQPSVFSSVHGVSLSANTRAFIANLKLELVSVSVSFTNPAASVLGARAVEVIDLAVFEEDLTLFGLVGEGVALAFAQCEEVEGCTPNVTEEELTVALGQIQLSIRQLEAELEQTTDPVRRKQVEELLANYRSQQQEYSTYRSELQGLTEFEKQLESQFAAEENQVDQEALERQVKVVETIYTRVRFLESLRFNQERRKLFAERTGLELTDQRLKEIIDSTLKSAARAEARVESMLKGEK